MNDPMPPTGPQTPPDGPDPSTGPTPDPRLGPDDARALDALVEARFDPSAVPGEHAESALRLSMLLGPLDHPPPGLIPPDPAEAAQGRAERAGTVMRALGREDVTPAVAHSVGAAAGVGGEADLDAGQDHVSGGEYAGELAGGLDHASADAVDAYVMAVCSAPAGAPPRLPARHEARGAVLTGIGSALRGLGPENEAWVQQGRAGRIDGVMRTIAASTTPSMPIDRLPSRRITLRDAVAVASVVLLLSAVALPIVSAVRFEGQRAMCLTHLGDAAEGLGLYTADHADQLPMATAGFGGSWIRVGEDPARSNSANLYTMGRTGYVPFEVLACPANDHAAGFEPAPGAMDWDRVERVSFSYQILPGAARPTWMLPSGSVVLTDRSPVVLNIVRGEPIEAEANSPNHRAKGQYVLRLDGSVSWSPGPVLQGGDNLWLPRRIEMMLHSARSRVGLVSGADLPDSPEDAFVGP